MKRRARVVEATVSSIAALRRELKKREMELKRLTRLEKSLRATLASVERRKAALIGVADAGVPTRKPRRARKSARKKKKSDKQRPAAPPQKAKAGGHKVASVATLVVEIAREHPKGVTSAQMAELLLKRGVRTKSKNFRKMIAIAITKHPGLKRIKKGIYTVKG